MPRKTSDGPARDAWLLDRTLGETMARDLAAASLEVVPVASLAEGEAKAIDTVFKAIHEGKPSRELLSYEYLQMLPSLAEGDSNKVFVIPSEFAEAFGGIGEAIARRSKPDSPE